jgi:ESCRT-II complex subunit VPS22
MVQVLEACWASRPHDGGLLELRAARTAVIKRRGRLADAVSEDDIVRAVKSLKVCGLRGFVCVAGRLGGAGVFL